MNPMPRCISVAQNAFLGNPLVIEHFLISLTLLNLLSKCHAFLFLVAYAWLRHEASFLWHHRLIRVSMDVFLLLWVSFRSCEVADKIEILLPEWVLTDWSQRHLFLTALWCCVDCDLASFHALENQIAAWLVSAIKAWLTLKLIQNL